MSIKKRTHYKYYFINNISRDHVKLRVRLGIELELESTGGEISLTSSKSMDPNG